MKVKSEKIEWFTSPYNPIFIVRHMPSVGKQACSMSKTILEKVGKNHSVALKQTRTNLKTVWII